MQDKSGQTGAHDGQIDQEDFLLFFFLETTRNSVSKLFENQLSESEEPSGGLTLTQFNLTAGTTTRDHRCDLYTVSSHVTKVTINSLLVAAVLAAKPH